MPPDGYYYRQEAQTMTEWLREMREINDAIYEIRNLPETTNCPKEELL